MGGGAGMSTLTFRAFDALAEEHGFIPVYPDGFESHWNDCRASASYAANTQDIDDVGFLRELVLTLQARHGVDPERVYATGLSNGGQMAYRLGLEAPELVAGIAAIAANLPIGDNLDCAAKGRAVPTLIINGTDDPVNPYAGGVVEILGNSSRGTVLSSLATANYWARLSGVDAPGVENSWPDRAP